MKSLIAILAVVALATSCREQEVNSNGQPSRLRAVQTIANDWTMQDTYTYHTDGRIARIEWERNTPYTTKGVDVYQYDGNLRLTGLVRSISGLVDEQIQFIYDGARIAGEVSWYEGVKEKFTFYEYNDAGQLVKSEFHRRNPEANGFALETEVHYAYHPHGNVAEIKTYVFDSDLQQLRLHTTKAYPDYLLTRFAPLDTEFSLPGIRLQKNLPTRYILTTPDKTLDVTFTYRWMPDGKLLDRTVQFPNGQTEQSIYTFE
ncbi:MAG: hypothetical protein JNL17_07680 [Cyclobacteriaceae bacterium]|nr:hypothetical protein [Cyclobacteriaceae bacterium]